MTSHTTKKLLAVLVTAVVAYMLLVGIFLQKQKITNLVTCSLHSKTFYIPSQICRTYLLELRSKKSDVAQLRRQGGVKYILGKVSQINADNKDKDDQAAVDANARILLQHFLRAGLDINQVGRDDGMTALHREVMFNQPKWVKYLLEKGANPAIRSKYHHLTALEIAFLLQAHKPTMNRARIIAILKSHTKPDK